MKIAIQILLTAIYMLSISGCSYSDPDIFYVDPVPGDTVSVVLSTNLDTVDVAKITDSLLFIFRAEIEGGKFYVANASVGNELIYAYYSDYDPDTISGPYVFSDSFWIMQDLGVGPGMSSLLLEIYHSANTNSLADIVGVEAGVVKTEFDILLEGGDN